MTDRTYPYTAWFLQSSFRPKTVTLVGRSWPYSYPDFDRAESGRSFDVKDLFTTKEAAIKAGLARIDKEQVALAKKHASLEKRRAALGKAAKEPQ